MLRSVGPNPGVRGHFAGIFGKNFNLFTTEFIVRYQAFRLTVFADAPSGQKLGCGCEQAKDLEGKKAGKKRQDVIAKY